MRRAISLSDEASLTTLPRLDDFRMLASGMACVGVNKKASDFDHNQEEVRAIRCSSLINGRFDILMICLQASY